MAQILGLFNTAEGAANATELLGKQGITNDHWEVLTDSPYPEGAFGEKEPHHTLFRYPLLGALVGFTTGLLYTAGTQMAFPIATGGKPILSIPPMIIIMYELTMMGALTWTFLGIIIESRLPRVSGVGLYDARVTEGHVAIIADVAAERLDLVERTFKQAGAVDIKRAR